MLSSQKRISTSMGILILALIFVVAGGILTYQYLRTDQAIPPGINMTKNQTPTSQIVGWKTLKNDNYGFELEYPGNWSVTPNNVSVKANMAYEFYEKIGDAYSTDFNLDIKQNLDNFTIDEMFRQIYPIENETESNFTEYRGPIMLSDGTTGRMYYHYKESFSPSEPDKTIYIFKIGDVFFIFKGYAFDEANTYKIISSLKFYK
jgi:hypothetical protein